MFYLLLVYFMLWARDAKTHFSNSDFLVEKFILSIDDIALIWGFNIDMDIAKQCTH